MGIKFYDSNGKYWGEYDETRNLFIPSEETTTQTETQNSNLTFEKDECAKEYEELGLKELKELINADRKTENSSENPNNCEELNAYRECVKSRSFWDSKHCDGCYFDERCPFDEPKDEPQTEVVNDSQDLVKDLVKPCENAINPSGDVWECGCFLDTYCEHQIYDRNPDGTINIVKCGYEPIGEPQTDCPWK